VLRELASHERLDQGPGEVFERERDHACVFEVAYGGVVYEVAVTQIERGRDDG
jgi:hypothetical protein